jgi:hypothetical protein
MTACPEMGFLVIPLAQFTTGGVERVVWTTSNLVGPGAVRAIFHLNATPSNVGTRLMVEVGSARMNDVPRTPATISALPTL